MSEALACFMSKEKGQGFKLPVFNQTSSEDSYIFGSLFQAVSENSGDGIFLTDIEGRFLYVNSIFCKYLGYRDEELHARNIRNFISVESEAYFLSMMETQQIYHHETGLNLKNGSQRVTDIKCKPFELGNQKVFLGIVAINEKRKAVEKSLHHERNRAQIYLDTVEAIIVALDVKGRITLINQKGCRIFDCSEDDLLGQNWFSKCLPQTEGIEDVYAAFLKLIDGEYGVVEYYENPIVTRNGDIRHIAWHNALLRDEHGHIIGTLSAGEDITERKKAEEDLKHSHQTFLTVLDGIDATVYVADMNTYEILFMNKNMINTYNADFTGRLCHASFRGENKPCGHCTNTRLIDERGNPTGVHIWETNNPITGKWYINYDRAIRWMDGRTVRLQIATDITKLKQTEAALKQANSGLELRVAERTEALSRINKELVKEIAERKRTQRELYEAKIYAEAASRAKSEFLANMSHEFRTPLNHIIGFAQVVVDKQVGELNEVQGEYLTDVIESGRHMLSLINDILDLSKVEAGKMLLDTSEINVSKILENSLSMFQEKAMKHGIELNKRISGIPETIYADERKLKQIVYNLMSNAIKFTPAKGRITLQARSCDLSHMVYEDSNRNGDAGIEISVADTGIGIRSDDIHRIFDSFEQIDNSARKQFQGTGLGLALTKRIVELHGGKIWAESDGENKGSTFRFTIPVQTD